MSGTVEFYEQAISKLQNYRASEPDPDKRAEATAKIEELFAALQGAHFDAIASRTERLTELMTTLQGIMDEAGSGSSISGAIGEIGELIGKIGSAITGDGGDADAGDGPGAEADSL